MKVVSVKNVSKFYGQKQVLDNVSFDIEEKEIFGLLGSNGAGKSTITSIILGLEKQSSGNVVLFEGQKKNLKKRIALVPQSTAFYKDFSVEKNLRFFASVCGLKSKQIKPRVKFLMSWLSLEPFKDVKAGHLSGGYQRLLNIACSLVHDPELIFFDEPTVGLDPKMRQMFWLKIQDLKAAGKTIIITTHYMDEAEKLCTKLALMKNGKMLVIGKPRELISQYGGIKVMIFNITGGVKKEDIQKIRTVLNQFTVISRDELLFIPFEQEHTFEKVIAVTEWLMKKGYNISSSITKEPNLEDVFLNITGEGMKQQE
ncbi:MAG: ABC transporter ATP-binding protein [Candidatus Diapherotrites archaeon]|jgi:ABC-2 type transport system ATP-binding protein|uniref:ABC transporter ATP-binding protein n=1 Tax=Candidatus Iainarchaeum sp. TaxID=3101447 RepID=A0A7K4BYF0_9ARCH|nr:ABC transporter ATP-binding protein [Candidatus Diapherotrites archaeon]